MFKHVHVPLCIALYDEVLEKAIELTKDLTVGNTVDNTFMGPVINKTIR